MRRHTRSIARVPLVCCAAVLVVGVASLRAQPETITATAALKGPGGATVTAPVSVTIVRYASEAERDELMAAVKSGGTASVAAWLGKRADAGTIRVGTIETVVKYAFVRPTGSGRLITVLTAKPIALVGAGLPDAKGYDVGLALIEVSETGPGTGELMPATKVGVDAKGAITTEGYNSEVVHLSNIVKK